MRLARVAHAPMTVRLPTATPAENQRIADRLREAAQLLQAQGASPYRADAYREAAASLERLPRDVRAIHQSEGLRVGAHRNGRPKGICGQAPSDYPEYAEFLVRAGIGSISLNPDSALATIRRIVAIEAA